MNEINEKVIHTNYSINYLLWFILLDKSCKNPAKFSSVDKKDVIPVSFGAAGWCARAIFHTLINFAGFLVISGASLLCCDEKMLQFLQDTHLKMTLS